VAEINSTAIAEAALKPQAVTVDGRSATAHSLPDQIEADKYRRQAEAAGNPAAAMFRVRISPPGAQ
jgi:hypothetical protein